MTTCKNKHKIPFLVLTITAYVVIIAGVIYMARQSPGTCPFVSMCSASTPKTVVPVTKAKEIKLPMLLELGSKRCVPCQMMEPILADLTKEYAGILKVSFVDVWIKKNIAVGKKYKINSIPVQIFFDAEGKELWRHTGYFSKEDILKKWKALGYDLPALKKTKK
jgi:thioredoxin